MFNLKGEKRSTTGLFDLFRGSFGIRRYKHDERDGEVVATAFTNNSTELELLGHHRGRLNGSVGGSVLTRSFLVDGEEALSPPVDQTGFAGFVYEEFAASPHVQLQFGGRVDHASFDPERDEPARDFTEVSGSAGLLLLPNDSTTIAFSLARAARNPALEELYFHGPHPGNNAFENGNPDLASEQALGFDASLRWRSLPVSGEVTFFINRINDFIFRELTPEVEDGLQVTNYTQADARFVGLESHADVRVSSVIFVEGGLDYVRGTLTASEMPLPRIPPLRGRAGIRYQKNAFQTGADAVFTAKQERIFTLETSDGVVGETVTDGYNLLKLYATYSLAAGRAAHTFTVRLDNAMNERYQNHLNYLKDLVPETGRTLRVVYGVKY